MHDAHAADAVFLALVQERQHGVARLFHAQAVQVELGAGAPLAAAQVARGVGGGVAAHEGGAAFGQQVRDFAAIRNAGVGSRGGFAQRVGAAQGRGRLRRRLVFGARDLLDGLDRLHGAPERGHVVGRIGVRAGRRRGFLQRRHALGEGGALLLGLQVFLEAFQVGRADLIAPHSPATVVRPGRPCSPCRRW